MCYDISAKHRVVVRENSKRMDEIREENPTEYFKDVEWQKLSADNSWRQHMIRDYDRKIKMGIKF